MTRQAQLDIPTLFPLLQVLRLSPFVGIRGLFKHGTTAIIDVRVANLDSPSYLAQDPDKALAAIEKHKIDKCLPTCLSRRESFHRSQLMANLAPMLSKFSSGWLTCNLTHSSGPTRL